MLTLAACNNKNENQDSDSTANAVEQNEAAAPEPSQRQDPWMKQSTLLGSKPMVVDFYATWCGPCKQLAPILEEIEQVHKGEVIFKRVDVDQEPELAQEFRVEAIPMLLFVTPSGEYQAMVGLQEADAIESKIAELLSRSTKNL